MSPDGVSIDLFLHYDDDSRVTYSHIAIYTHSGDMKKWSVLANCGIHHDEGELNLDDCVVASRWTILRVMADR